jgi:glyoxylate reductase
MKPAVLIARELPAPARELLEGHAELDVHLGENPLTKAELISRLAGKQALICQLTLAVDKEVLTAAQELRIVANVAVGYDNVDVAVATERGVAVTNTPGVLDDSTADFVWALLLGVARRVAEADQLARSGQWRGWDLMQLLGTDVHGKTLGIFGLGRIGQRVAERARGFSMQVLYHNRNRLLSEEEERLDVRWVEMDTLLVEADFVVVQTPLTAETRHFLGAEEFGQMKTSAYLINASRGPVVDEQALVAALEAKQIAGAALDVYEEEPRIHPKLQEMPNVLLAPHIASATVETRTRMAVMATENVLAVLRGERPPNPVNPEVFGKSAAGKA